MKPNFALQLYSLRGEIDADPVGVLKQVAAMGFPAVEFAGYYGMDAKTMKQTLDDCGLKAVSAHIGWWILRDKPGEEMEFHHTVGNRDLVIPSYGFNTLEDAKRAPEIMANLMKPFLREGFRIGYHNHALEFKPLDDNGTCAMDYLETVDGLLFQPDVFWIKTAGRDPMDFLRKNRGRLISVHMKEYGADGKNAEFGTGILPWRQIMDEAKAGGATLGIVEQEEYSCPKLESVAICAANVEKIFGK